MNKKHLILGGQKSGKTKYSEKLAVKWLKKSPQNKAILLATAIAYDEEIIKRINNHKKQRAKRVPKMQTIDVHENLAQIIKENSNKKTLLIIDCLTMWLTQITMPPDNIKPKDHIKEIKKLNKAIKKSKSKIIIVGNEIGLGITPLGREVRKFIDILGFLNQKISKTCNKTTMIIAGNPIKINKR